MRTGPIRYNVRDRGRKHRGQDRNFDTVALARLIASGDVQERVKNRDLFGYFGHWPRVAFGMNPAEGGVLDGKQVTVEPAFVTVGLSAQDDGTIEHEAEFLDTAPGRTAKRLFCSKAGGFSSAIDARKRGSVDVPVGFFGFDYVLEPNFSTNRGYALDAVGGDAGDRLLLLDGAAMETQAAFRVLDGLYTALQGDYDRALQSLRAMEAENNELLGMLAQGAATPVYDGATPFERPLRTGDARDFADLVHGFSGATLAGFESMPTTGEDREQVQELQQWADRLVTRR